MALIQALYFSRMPESQKPKRTRSEAVGNRAVRGSQRDTSGVYAKADKPHHHFKRKLLPKIEAARKAGDVVRFIGNQWFINGEALS